MYRFIFIFDVLSLLSPKFPSGFGSLISRCCFFFFFYSISTALFYLSKIVCSSVHPFSNKVRQKSIKNTSASLSPDSLFPCSLVPFVFPSLLFPSSRFPDSYSVFDIEYLLEGSSSFFPLSEDTKGTWF